MYWRVPLFIILGFVSGMAAVALAVPSPLPGFQRKAVEVLHVGAFVRQPETKVILVTTDGRDVDSIIHQPQMSGYDAIKAVMESCGGKAPTSAEKLMLMLQKCKIVEQDT